MFNFFSFKSNTFVALVLRTAQLCVGDKFDIKLDNYIFLNTVALKGGY